MPGSYKWLVSFSLMTKLSTAMGTFHLSVDLGALVMTFCAMVLCLMMQVVIKSETSDFSSLPRMSSRMY